MKVLKFGGTSVGSVDALKCVFEIIAEDAENSKFPIVVCSAFSGITNKLVEVSNLAKQKNIEYTSVLRDIEDRHIDVINKLIDVKNQGIISGKVKILLNKLEDILSGVFLLGELSNKMEAFILSFGEQMSCQIIAKYLKQNKLNSRYIDSRQLIITNSDYINAVVNFEKTNAKLKTLKHSLLTDNYIPIITGFIASNDDNHTTILGRGGSDYTASIIGSGLQVDVIEIWTDVDGIMTTDPKQVKHAYTIPEMSYQEAMELSHFGAKIIYSPTIYPAFKSSIPIIVKNTFNKTHPGTIISQNSQVNPAIVKGVSSIDKVSVLNIQGSSLVGIPGILGRVANALAKNNVNIILITQASSEYSICVVVSLQHSQLAENVLNTEFATEILLTKADKIVSLTGFSIVSIVGEGMRNHAGLAGRFLSSLGKHGINLTAIAQGSSELNISAVIAHDMLTKALNVVHDAFFAKHAVELNVFMLGIGLIGNTLIQQMRSNELYLKQEKELKINIVGLANTKKMLIKNDGIDTFNYRYDLQDATDFDLSKFIKIMKQMNLANTVFVDCTGSKAVVGHYVDILSSSIAIVTPNKIANSSSYESYKYLHDLAIKYNTKFLYETNVGAGLPIINTLQNLKASGDKIIKIEGVLSGTLSYIFNNFTNDKKFSDIVREAKEKGYTEPDPRDDLNGTDVARKILILAREAGANLEMNAIQYNNILPLECQQAQTIDEFFIALEKHEQIFEDKKIQALKENKVLRFIASYADGSAIIELKMVDENHPFYNLSGSDNIVSFITERYKERPLVVRGPGAGAEVTASGVFAEIINVGSYLKR